MTDRRTLAQERVELVHQCLREGYTQHRDPQRLTPGTATSEAARRAKMTLTGFISALRAAEALGIEVDWNQYRQRRYQQPVPKAVLLPAEGPPPEAPSGPAERVLAIGDLHQDPRHPDRLEVLTWIARYASEQRFDRIVQIGDWSTFDSVNFHDKNDHYASRLKPSIRQDLDNLQASHKAFRAGMAPDYKPKLMFLQGNHEYRLERFENAHPEAIGTYTLERDQIFAQWGWQMRRYGELFYVNGVAFTHHPNNAAGRAYGGKTGPQRAANDSTVPIVSGHTHRRQVHDCPKNGPVDVISMIELGCALPWGTIESYAQHGMTGWWYGVVPMTCQGGVITDVSFVSMLTLEAQYGAERQLAA